MLGCEIGALEVRVLHDPEGTFVLMIELQGWSSGARVFGEEPSLVPWGELWCRCPLLIGYVLIALLGIDHAGRCELVNFRHS